LALFLSGLSGLSFLDLDLSVLSVLSLSASNCAVAYAFATAAMLTYSSRSSSMANMSPSTTSPPHSDEMDESRQREKTSSRDAFFPREDLCDLETYGMGESRFPRCGYCCIYTSRCVDEGIGVGFLVRGKGDRANRFIADSSAAITMDGKSPQQSRCGYSSRKEI
jgi:hypothetical protein